MNELVCPNCGESDRFHEDVEVTIHTYRTVRLVEKEGKPAFKSDTYDYDLAAGHREVSTVGPVKCDCGAEFRNGTGDLRVVWTEWYPGDAAILPDGLRGFVESCVGGVVRIVGWHEEFDVREISPAIPSQRAERLAV